MFHPGTPRMPSEPIALPILDPADVLTAAYDQLVRYRAYVEAAHEITRGSSTPRPTFNVPSSSSSSSAVSHAHSNATSLENSATATAAVAVPTALEVHSKLPDTVPNSTSTFLFYSPATHTPFSERDLLLPLPYTLRLTPLTLTLHAFLPVLYAERPLLGIDAHSLVILARDLPSRPPPPSPPALPPPPPPLPPPPPPRPPTLPLRLRLHPAPRPHRPLPLHRRLPPRLSRHPPPPRPRPRYLLGLCFADTDRIITLLFPLSLIGTLNCASAASNNSLTSALSNTPISGKRINRFCTPEPSSNPCGSGTLDPR